MGGATAEESLCACYRERQEFQKVIELEGPGLVVYCRTSTRREDVQPGELIGTTTGASQDAFILHNTKDVKITPSDLKPALEKNDIICPRCRQIFEHAQELLHKVKLIDRKNVMGVCDHCLKKAQSIKKPCYECKEIEKKFISTREKQKEDTKRCIKLWLTKMSDFVKGVITPDKKVKTRAYSDLQIDQLCQYSPKSRREPEVKQMYYRDKRKSDTNLYTETDDINLTETFEKSVGFTQEKLVDTQFATYGGESINTITAGPWLVESDTIFGEPHRVAKEPQRTSLKDRQDHHEVQEQFSEYYDDSTMDLKDKIKKKHDLSLRHMIKTEKKTRTPFRPQIYEIPKIAPWELETISKHSDDSEIDVKLTTKTNRDASSQEIVSSKDENLHVTSHTPPKHKSLGKRDLKPETLKQMIGPEIELKSLQSVHSKPIKYVTSKTSQKNLRESVMDVKGATKRKFDLNLKHMMGFDRLTRDSSEQHRGKKYTRAKLTKGIYDSEEITKKIKKRDAPHLTDNELKYKRSLAKFSHEAEKPGQRIAKTKIKGEKPIDTEKIPEYVLRKQFSYFFPKTLEKKEKILGARSSQLIKNTQERLRQRAEAEKKRREEELKYLLDEEEKKRLAREEKKRLDEEQKKQQIYMEDKNKLPEVTKYIEKDPQSKMISEEGKIQYMPKDRDKIDSLPEYETKDLRRKPELKEKDDQVIGKGTKVEKLKTEPIDKMDEGSENIKKSLKSKSEQKDKIDAISEKPKKEVKSKPEPSDKIDEVLEKQKKELKLKPERRDKIDDMLEKQKKELKSKPERRDKIDDMLEKPKKELKSKSEPRDKIDDVLEKSKKELNSKLEQRDKVDDVLEKPKKELKSKTEPRDKIDDVLEKSKKGLKSKLEERDNVEDASEKLKKDLKAKPEQRDKIDGLSEKTKRDKSKSEPRDVSEGLSEITKKDVKSKSDKKDKIDSLLEKSKKDLKSKPEQGDKTHEVAVKTKQELKSKSEQKEKREDVIEKSKKAQSKDDEGPEKVKKDLKLKAETKEQTGDLTERPKRDSRSKSEPRNKIDEISEKAKKESKSEKSATTNEVMEKGKKDLKSKPELTDKIEEENEKKYKTKLKSTEKEPETSQKEVSKEERKQQLKRDQEDKDRLTQVAQLRKERESASHKKQDSTKESEEAPKKKIESSKEKKASSKKSEELSKEHVEPSKKGDLAKKLKESSADTEEPLATKEWTAKELKEFAKKQQDLEKEQISEKKQGLSKDVAEPSKIKPDSIKEKEGASKGKEKIIPKKEEPPKVKEESKEVASKVADTSKKPKDGMDEAQFRKLQAELAKQKEEDLKNKRMLDVEAQKLRDLAEKRAKEEADRKSKATREAKAVMKPEPARPSAYSVKEVKESTMKELKIRDIKIRNRSTDDLILRLVRIKQTATRQTIKPRPCDIDPEVLKAHKCHHKSGQTSSLCELCNDSELEIDVESYENKLNLKKDVSEIIIGEKIFKHKSSQHEKTEEREVVPILFQSIFQEEPLPPQEIVQIVPPETEPLQKPVLATLLQTKDSKGVEPEPGRGIIRYALSDRTFIDKGWTMLPTEKVVRKMNVYRMRPAHPEFDWFEHNKNKRLMNYDSGEKLAEFDDNGRGRWYYRSGRLALDYYDAEETNAQQRFVIYSSGEPDERGRTHPITILATFDYLGNGIVFDHAGKIRLKYNQTEGVVLDRGIGPVSHWKWHTLNDPPVLQQVMIDTQMAHKDPAIIKLGTPADTKTRPDNEEMLAIEFDNFIKEKSKKLSQKFKPFQIKMKALKINEHFSLKVLDQATIYLIFRDGSTNLKLNIGMILDHQEIVDTDTAEVGEVSNSLERFPARTDSLAGLQRSVAYAQRYERQRTERERRLRPPEPCASADQLTAAASPPLRLPLRTMPAGSTSSAGYCNCRKPANNLYYNTRLL